MRHPLFKNRHIPPFKWSKSWTYNVFRILEVFVGREYGLSFESGVCKGENGVEYRFFGTVESIVVFAEHNIREFLSGRKLAFKVVRIPNLQLAGISQFFPSAYNFAIAFDTSTTRAFAVVSSDSFAFTVTGSNPLILGGARSGVGADTITGMTYNSVSLSNGTSIPSTLVRATCVKFLKGPATGSNTFAITASAPGFLSFVWSYSGASQTGGMDNSTTNTATSTNSVTTSLTPVANNCWIMLFASTGGTGDPVSAGTGATQRATVNDDIIADSNTSITPAASYSMTVNSAGTSDWSISMISFAPFVAPAVGNSGFFNFFNFT